MRANSFLTIVCVAVTISISTFGQEKNDAFTVGYVVSLQGDTLTGSIQFMDHFSSSQTCTFKPKGTSDIINYTPSELRSFGIKGKKYFVAQEISEDNATVKVFLECIIRGDVSLFYYQDRFFILKSDSEMDELLILEKSVKRDDKVFNVEVEAFKGTLQEAMNDCSTISQNIKSTDLNKKDLTKLFVEYYNCTMQGYNIFESVEYKIKLNTYLSLGSGLSGLKISKGLGSYAYLNDKKPTYTVPLFISFIVEYSQLSTKDKLRIRTGLMATFCTNELSYDLIPNNVSFELTIETIRLELPILVKYNLNGNRNGTYFFAGMGLNTFIKWDETLLVKSFSSANVLSEFSDLDKSILFPSLIGGLGYNLKINNHPVFIEFDYNGTQILKGKSISTLAFITNFGFKIGYSFGQDHF